MISVPINPNKIPTITIPADLRTDPDANVTAPINPNTIKEKYSAGPILKAKSINGAANAAKTIVPTHPAKNDPIAATASAGPPRPANAILCPLIIVITEPGSPGKLINIAVVDPPYCDP